MRKADLQQRAIELIKQLSTEKLKAERLKRWGDVRRALFTDGGRGNRFYKTNPIVMNVFQSVSSLNPRQSAIQTVGEL